MELKRKQKIVQIVGAAEASLEKLENDIRSWEALGKSPPKVDKQLLKSVIRALDRLKTNPFAGNAVPQHLWPPEYAVLPNLFRMELSNFWRLLYYVTGDEVKVISVVFEICNHKKYDKIFGYDKK